MRCAAPKGSGARLAQRWARGAREAVTDEVSPVPVASPGCASVSACAPRPIRYCPPPRFDPSCEAAGEYFPSLFPRLVIYSHATGAHTLSKRRGCAAFVRPPARVVL